MQATILHWGRAIEEDTMEFNQHFIETWILAIMFIFMTILLIEQIDAPPIVSMKF